jgi:hypothetical protein
MFGKFSSSLSQINKINEKHVAREQEKKKERTEIQTKDHTQKCKTHDGEP